MNFLLNIDSGASYGETLLFGGQVVLIGIVTVFAVLGLLWACLTVFKFVFHDAANKKTAKIVPDTTVREEVSAPVVYASNDDEIIAAIAAAIAMAESESFGTKFRVVSFRRK